MKKIPLWMGLVFVFIELGIFIAAGNVIGVVHGVTPDVAISDTQQQP